LTDWTVTLYKLFLGDQDATTGHYQRGYTIHTIEAALFPEGGTWNFGTSGYISTSNAIAFSGYIFDEGDVLLNQISQHFMVKHLKKWPIGESLKFVVYELEEINDFPFLAGFFGFEDIEHGTFGSGFEDGFERGYWAL